MTKCTNCGSSLEKDVKFCPSCGTQVVDICFVESTLIGRTLNNKYRILSEIGSGSMGTVYQAEHIGLKKNVAIKVLRPDLMVGEEALRRFQREGIAAGKFSHPNAIQIFDFDRSEGQNYFLAMEFVEGVTLKDVVIKEGRLSPEAAVEIICQVLSVLDAAHKEGIVHRDLKPENIMVLEQDGEKPRIKVLDFGLSKLVDRPTEDSIQTQAGQILGSPRYMAPEQCAGDPIDHRIDLYTTGLILFELLAGAPPTQGNTFTEILLKRTSESAPQFTMEHPDLEIPKDLDLLLKKTLERDPKNRYQTAGEMIEVLEKVDYEKPADKSQVIEKKTGDSSGITISKRSLVLGLLVVVLAVCGILFFGNGDANDAPARVSLKSPEQRTELENRYVMLLQDARIQLRSREFEKALSYADKAVHMECADEEAYLVRALIYHKRGELDMAHLDYDEALKLDTNYGEARAGLGWLHLDKKDPAKALAAFNAALAMDQRCTSALIGQGVIHFQEEEDEKAMTCFTEALVLDTSSAKAHYYLAEVHFREGNLDLAMEEYIQAKRNDSRAPEAYIGLGKVHQEQEDLEQAKKQFSFALEQDPGSLEAVTCLGVLLTDEGNFLEARDLLKEAVKRHSEDGRLHILLGTAYYAGNDVEEAIACLKKGVSIIYDDYKAIALLAMLLHQQKDYVGALEQYEIAIAYWDRDPRLFMNQGLAFIANEQYEEAGVSLEKSLELDPDNALVCYNLGVLYKDYLNRINKAVDLFKKFDALGGLDSSRNRKVAQWLANQGY